MRGRAGRGATGDAACATRVSNNGGVDSKNVGHCEKRGGTSTELSGEGGVALDKLKIFADATLSHHEINSSHS